MTFKVFVARMIPDNGIKILKDAGFDVTVNEDADRVLSKEELIEKAKDCDGLLSLLTDKVDEDVLNACPNLKIVANYAVGIDNINTDAATGKNIVVTNTPGVLTQTVAEHTFALIMASASRIIEANDYTKAGKYKAWGPLLLLGQDLKGKTLGIAGLGRIGKTVAQIAVKGYGMNVIYVERNQDSEFENEFGAKFVDKETLVKESDFISIHLPMLDATKHFLSFDEFNAMKDTAIIVNTARGPIVDEEALVDALKNKKIAGAALDVFECEPDISCNHDRENQLKDFENVIMTPHIASASIETRGKMAEMAAQSIVDFANGKTPEHVVNSDVVSKK